MQRLPGFGGRGGIGDEAHDANTRGMRMRGVTTPVRTRKLPNPPAGRRCAAVDVSRGDVIAAAGDPPQVADQFAAHRLWMGEQALLPGRPYWLKIGARTVTAQVTDIQHKVDVNTQAELAARTLDLNEVGDCNLSLDQAIAFEPYASSRTLGGVILIDRQTHATVAAGMDKRLHARASTPSS